MVRDLARRGPAAAAAVLLAAATVAAAPPGERQADALSLSVRPGLDGLARLGRWTAVAITIENTGLDVTGELHVEAGASRAIRPVVLPSPSRKRIEMYLRVRSPDVDRVRVAIVSGGRELEGVHAPLRLLPDTSAFVVCAPEWSSAGREEECTVRPDPAALPRSWRGYDAADAVSGALSTAQELDDEQRVALERWQVLRAGDLLVPPVVQPPAAPDALTGTRAVAVLYVSIVLLVALAVPRLAARPAIVFAALATASLTGAAAAIVQGRIGAGSTIVLNDAALLRVAEGLDGAFVSVSGTVQFPAYGSFELRPAFPDGILTPREDGDVLRFAENGDSVMGGVFAKGQLVRFELEGFADVGAVHIARQDSMVRVRNAFAGDLADCELPAGFSPQVIGPIAPGATLEMRQHDTAGQAALRCRVGAEIPSLVSRGARVSHHGAAVLVLALGSAAQ